jgi:hypothetical protein
MRDRIFVLTLVLGALLTSAPAAAQDQAAENPQAVVFLPLEDQGEGAPGRSGIGRTVLLTDLGKDDPWYAAVEVFTKAGIRDVVGVHPWNPDAAFARLAKLGPEFVIGVFAPETLDVNFHFDLLERSSRLDADPFVDFALGYVTGATPEEAVAFAQTTLAARKRTPIRSILEFGPSSNPASLTQPKRHPWADGFTTRRFSHAEDDAEVAAQLAGIKGVGILSAWGHGMPDGVDHGIKGRQVREAGLDLFPALYFSGPCYCGVPARWFEPSGGAVHERRVGPEASFLLAMLGARVSAMFAGLDPDRGETNHHELEHVLTTGAALGHASKSTYDDVVLAYRRKQLDLPHYMTGKPDPHRNLADTMIAGGACRALFGDPSWAPFPKVGPSPFEVTARPSPKGIRVSWVRDEPLGKYWQPVDIYRADGGWTHRLRFRCEIPKDRARRLRSLQVLAVEKDGKSLPFVFPTAAVELWGGKTILHAMIVFPRDEKDRALWNGRRFEAHLALE